MNRISKKKKRRRLLLLGLTLLIILTMRTLFDQDDSNGEPKGSQVPPSDAPEINEEDQGISLQIEPTLNEQLIKTYPNYYIQAALDEKKFHIQGELELFMKNPGTETIEFYAYPYAWAPMKIMDVKLNNQENTFEFDGKTLTFNNQIEEEDLHIWIQFETPIPQGGTRFGVKDNVWLITTWYPMLGVLNEQNQWLKRPDPVGMGDPFYFRFANYTVEWTTPSNIKWLSSGHLESEETIGEKKTTIWKVDQVRNFGLVGSPDYIIKQFQLNEQTTVSIALTKETNMEKVENIARNTYPLFSKIYGQLPSSDVAIAETSYQTNYALEYPNLAIFSKDMYEQDKIEHWIPHEIGHIWWYNAVGVDETVNGWLDEGMAEQGVVWYLENRYSKERAQQLWDQYRLEHQKLIQIYPNKTMNVGLHGFDKFNEFDYSWYSRSADMFLTLRQALGDEKYVLFLNTLYVENIGKIADEQSLNRALANSLGLQTDLFKRWLHEPYSQTQWEIKFTEINNNL